MWPPLGGGLAQIPGMLRFGFETLALVGAAIVLFGLLLRQSAADVTGMILTGVILGVMLRGLVSMVQRLLDPAEFAVVQKAMFASFGRVDPGRRADRRDHPRWRAIRLQAVDAPAIDLGGRGRIPRWAFVPCARAKKGPGMIRISSLSLRAGQAEILRDINLTLPQGGIIALIGPNGAGKFTLLHCIAGLMSNRRPSS